MPILFKPGNRTWGKTEHLKDVRIKDHRDLLDKALMFSEVSPDTGAMVDEMAQWHRWGALDQDTFYKMQAGSFAGESMKLVAMIPPAVASLLHMYYPNILKDREEFRKLLNRHPEWKVPGGWD